MSSQILLSLAIRSFAPPLLALIIVAAWRKSSASSRRMVWIMCFVVLTLLPVALLKLPTAEVVDTSRAAPRAISAKLDNGPAFSVAIAPRDKIASTLAAPGLLAPSYPGMVPGRSAINPVRKAWFQYGAMLWAIGTLLVLTHWFAGFVRLSRLPLHPVLDDRLVFELETACRRAGLIRFAPAVDM